MIYPQSYQDYLSHQSNRQVGWMDYKKYITDWVAENRSEAGKSEDIIIFEQMINAFRAATTYASDEELSFLRGMNWNIPNNPTSFEKEKYLTLIKSSIPIIAKLLKRMADNYRETRNTLHYRLEKMKSVGSELSVTRTVYDAMMDWAQANRPNITNDIKNASISIDPYIDMYPDYFGSDRSDKDKAEYVDIDKDIYFDLDRVLRDMVYDGRVYLLEIPIIVRNAINMRSACIGDKAEMQKNLVARTELSGITVDDKVTNKKNYYSKLLGNDIHFISKNKDVTTGKLIVASNPSANALNNITIDTPTIDHRNLVRRDYIGNAFRPSKMGMLRVNGKYELVMRDGKIPEGVTLIPDPEKGVSSCHDVIVNYSDFTKGVFAGAAALYPNVGGRNQSFTPYFDKARLLPSTPQKGNDFDDIVDAGYVTKSTEDLWGNKIAILNDETNMSINPSIWINDALSGKSTPLSEKMPWMADLLASGTPVDIACVDDYIFVVLEKQDVSTDNQIHRWRFYICDQVVYNDDTKTYTRAQPYKNILSAEIFQSSEADPRPSGFSNFFISERTIFVSGYITVNVLGSGDRGVPIFKFYKFDLDDYRVYNVTPPMMNMAYRTTDVGEHNYTIDDDHTDRLQAYYATPFYVEERPLIYIKYMSNVHLYVDGSNVHTIYSIVDSANRTNVVHHTYDATNNILERYTSTIYTSDLK